MMNAPNSLLHSWDDAEWTRHAGCAWHSELMNARLTDRLHVKQGRSVARWTLATHRRRIAVFVKRHERHSIARSLLAWLMPSRRWSDAGVEWDRLRIAESAGVPTPRPVAMAEWLPRGGRLRSALVVEELTGMLPLHEAIPFAAKVLPPARFGQWKIGLIGEVVRVVRLLHDRRLFHQDLYFCHFYVRQDDIENEPADWRGRITLIDFHRLTRRRFSTLPARVKDLGQLLYSARVSGVTIRDIVRFWRLYRTKREGLLRRLVAWKAARYQRHNDKRRRP